MSCTAKTLLSPRWISAGHTSISVRVSTPESTTPEDFDPIFSQGVVIVGGHAVNLWASFYAARGDPELAQFAPFTSKDADIFLTDTAIASAIAASAGWEFHGNPEPRSPVLGILVMQRGATFLYVEVRSQPGQLACRYTATHRDVLAGTWGRQSTASPALWHGDVAAGSRRPTGL